jgi:hypothetical protein
MSILIAAFIMAIASIAGILYLHHLGQGPRLTAGITMFRALLGGAGRFVDRQHYDHVIPAFRAMRIVAAVFVGGLGLTALFLPVAMTGRLIVAAVSLVGAFAIWWSGREGYRQTGIAIVPNGANHVDVVYPAVGRQPIIRVFPFDADEDFAIGNISATQFTITLAAPAVGGRSFNWTVRERSESSVVVAIIAYAFWSFVVLALAFFAVGLNYGDRSTILLSIPSTVAAVALFFTIWRIGAFFAAKVVDGLEFGPNAVFALLRGGLRWDGKIIDEFFSKHMDSSRQVFNLANQEGFEPARKFALLKTIAGLVTTYASVIFLPYWAVFLSFKLAELWGWGMLSIYEYRSAQFIKKGRLQDAEEMNERAASFRKRSHYAYVTLTAVLLGVAIITIIVPGAAARIDTMYYTLVAVLNHALDNIIGALATGIGWLSGVVAFGGLLIACLWLWPQSKTRDPRTGIDVKKTHAPSMRWLISSALALATLFCLGMFGVGIVKKPITDAAEATMQGMIKSGALSKFLVPRLAQTQANAVRVTLPALSLPDAKRFEKCVMTVERREPSDVTYAKLADLPAGFASWDDTTAVVGKEYVYRVTADCSKNPEVIAEGLDARIVGAEKGIMVAEPKKPAKPTAPATSVAGCTNGTCGRTRELSELCRRYPESCK